MLNMMVNNETYLDDRHDITEILLKEALSTINNQMKRDLNVYEMFLLLWKMDSRS